MQTRDSYCFTSVDGCGSRIIHTCSSLAYYVVSSRQAKYPVTIGGDARQQKKIFFFSFFLVRFNILEAYFVQGSCHKRRKTNGFHTLNCLYTGLQIRPMRTERKRKRTNNGVKYKRLPSCTEVWGKQKFSCLDWGCPNWCLLLIPSCTEVKGNHLNWVSPNNLLSFLEPHSVVLILWCC